VNFVKRSEGWVALIVAGLALSAPVLVHAGTTRHPETPKQVQKSSKDYNKELKKQQKQTAKLQKKHTKQSGKQHEAESKQHKAKGRAT
jgi:hypothetical protein